MRPFRVPGCAVFVTGLISVAGIPLSSASAQVIITTEARSGQSNVFAVSNTDLLQTHLSSATPAGAFNAYASNNPAALYDGQFGPPGPSVGADAAIVAPMNGSTLTFAFDLAASPGGYTLTQLDSFASWDDGRDGQEYNIAYSTVADPSTYLPLANALFAPASGGYYSHSMVSVTSSSGPLATNVANLRYTFTSYENNGTGYREFDIHGAPVPEPTAFAAVAVAGLGLMGRRRAK